jgi:Zn-dependent metalloprotease
MKTSIKYTGILAVLFFSLSIFPPQNLEANSDNIFQGATIKMDKNGGVPVEIRFKGDQQISVASFFDAYKQNFNISEDNEFKSFRVFTDQLGDTHYRFKQYYKGLELAEVQYLVHEKNGSVYYAHGKLIHGLNLEVTPVLTVSEALTFALAHINAKSYMWENKKNEAFLKKEQNDNNATYYPKGELMISAGLREKVAENFSLVYRFDIYAQEPLGRYYVDVDAKNGEIIGVLPRLYYDVPGYGTTLYNGDVEMVVSDSDFYIPPDPPAHFHLDDWNAYGGSGESWWMADISLGNQGGYADGWYEVLDTEPITLTGTGQTLKFFHRYSGEPPEGSFPASYDGWDGMNVRISVDGGITWNILTNPTPAYTNSSLYSFGFMHGEGPGIPGWAGQLDNWTEVTFDLSSYSGQTIQIRFAFASDPAVSTLSNPNFFGWQIDNIVISSSAETLYANDGAEVGITASNVVRETTIIEGNYRLRESGRGGGIATLDMHNQNVYGFSTDFVDADSNFIDANDQAGVSAHWAVEQTYDYYLTKHGRHSYDDSDARIVSYVHYSDNFVNAFWDGGGMTIGDGDGTNYGPLVPLDVVGHEFTHGVTQYSSGLIYQGEQGALNESFSDIFGALVEFFVEGPNGDWLMGEDFALSTPPFRSMEDPNSRDDPDTYLGDFWAPTGPDNPDNGGVHTNSGVQNFWFYLLSEGGSDVNDHGDAYSVSGIGIEDAAQIAYRNLTVYLMPDSKYNDARLASINSALDLFGLGSNQVKAATNAWYAVGVGDPFGAYALNTTVNKTYLISGVDSLFLTTEVFNPDNDNVEVKAMIESLDQSISDTLQMYDDGLHKDSTAGDDLFGASWMVPSGERLYRVHINTFALDSSYHNVSLDAAHFTTIGPIMVDHYEIPQQTSVAFALKLYLRNDGLTDTATAVTVHVSTSDTNVTDIQHNDQNFGNIAPGQINTSGLFPVYTQNNHPNSIGFNIIVSSEGWDFWSDSIKVTVPTGLAEEETDIPLEYALKQSYPNPFNPTTTIIYQVPRPSEVQIEVYNTLGQKVRTLLKDYKEPGLYQVIWDGRNDRGAQVGSGVYLYRMVSGDFVKTRKMIMMK